MSQDATHRASIKLVARLTGAAYLGFIVTSVVANVLGGIGLGSAADMQASIAAGGLGFRIGLTIAFVSALLFALAAWGLYVLLRRVGKDLALLFLVLNAIGVAVQCASMLGLVAALQIGEPTSAVSPFTTEQVDALSLNAIEVYRTGFVLMQLFFGTWLFPLGILVWRSRFLPRVLGALLLADGVAVTFWFLEALVIPAHPLITIPLTIISLAAELGISLWLLIRGISLKDASAGLQRSVTGSA